MTSATVRNSIFAILVLAGIFAVIAFPAAGSVLNGIAGVSELLWLVAMVATLFWFVHSLWLKRILRARRIRTIRMRRLMREAVEQHSERFDG